MNERLKILRKELSLSQETFGKKLGVTGTAISRMEIGNRAVTEQMILAICREFNVREEWLRNGNGKIFIEFTEDEFSKAAATLSNDPFVKSLIIEYWKLDEDNKQLFRNFIHKLSDNMKNQEPPKKEKTVEELEEEYKKSRFSSAQKTALFASNTIEEDTQEKNA